MAMRQGDDLHYCRRLTIDNGKGEMPKHKFTSLVGMCRPAMRCRRDQIQAAVNFLCKPRGSHLAPLKVPCERRFVFRSGSAMKFDRVSRHRRVLPMASILRRTSSHGTVFALPESSSSTRRAISWSQDSSTDDSIAGSRLSIRTPASTARSSSGRANAFLRRSLAS
jgi:hypothetical protein